jgi:PAS domain S-box-containing protein
MSRIETSVKSSFDRLAAINRAITTSLNFSEALRLIVDNAAELFAADNSLLLLAEDDGMLRVRAAHAGSGTVSEFAGPMEESVIGDLSRHLKLDPAKELVTVPIVADGSLNGFLAIVRDSQLTPEEQWQLSALADQAAIALNNARLHEFQTGEAIRQRDESLAALRESHRKINNILESITDLYFQLDREWRFTDINRQTVTRFGKTREELLGQSIWEVFPRAVDSELYPQFQEALGTMVPVHFELISEIVPGVWYEAHVYPSKTGLSVYLRDITERKSAELTNSLLAAIVESSEDAIISKDLNGIINSWNKGAERIFGYTAEEAIGRPATLIISPDRFDEEPGILENLRQGGRVEHYEAVRRHKDGTLLDVSVTISPIRNEEGKIVGGSKIARDISERKRGEEQIRFQAHLLGAVEQGVIATDLNGTVVYWNSFAERLYGWSAADAVGANILEIIPAAEAREQAAILSKLKEGESWSGEFLVRRKDGSVFPAMVTGSPIVSEQGELVGVVGVSIDISERKRAELERAKLHESERAARAEAEKANRLKDEFLATLSHELRNPLNVILGYAEVLLRSDESRSSEFVRRAAEILKRNALAQSRLVRDLLDLSRLHIGKLSLNREAVSLMTIINNAVETVRDDAASKQIEIMVDAAEELIFVDADPLRLEQIIWNLLNNAVKFTPAGGRVMIRLADENARATLIVEDTGPGIEPEFLPHVFEMFRQADASSRRPHSGLGIGLALVQQLVGLHGGTVAVTSSLGQGAKFTVELPTAGETERPLGFSSPPPAGALSQMRILVVDDSADTVDMLHRLLEMEGALVASARSATEALEIAREKEFDVVLSDISMPGMDGFEFVRRLREMAKSEDVPLGDEAVPVVTAGDGFAAEAPVEGMAVAGASVGEVSVRKEGTLKDVPVIALTGFGRAEDIERAAAEGFLSHVTKPIDVNSLIETLRKLPVRDCQAAANTQN